MNLDPNPKPNTNHDYPNNLLDTILLLGYNDRIEWLEYKYCSRMDAKFPKCPVMRCKIVQSWVPIRPIF